MHHSTSRTERNRSDCLSPACIGMAIQCGAVGIVFKWASIANEYVLHFIRRISGNQLNPQLELRIVHSIIVCVVRSIIVEIEDFDWISPLVIIHRLLEHRTVHVGNEYVNVTP